MCQQPCVQVFPATQHLPLTRPLTETAPHGADQILLFWFEFPNPALVWEAQSCLFPWDPHKAVCRVLSLDTHSAFTSPVLPQGPVGNKLLYFNFSCDLFLNGGLIIQYIYSVLHLKC